MIEDLDKPCPFCGGHAELRAIMDGMDETYMIHCNRCHMSFNKFMWNSYDRMRVIEEWNARV